MGERTGGGKEVFAEWQKRERRVLSPQDVVRGSTRWVRIGPCSDWMRGSCYNKTGKKAGGKGTD